MKKIGIILVTLCLFLGSFQLVDAVSVKGYYRKDGTYVRPYTRSSPNGLKYDNYSWTPSQGLYNDSYGTRTTTWDTPSWYTQPDYWEGYYDYAELNNDIVHEGYELYGNPSYNSYSYGYGANKCPENSIYNSISSKCNCNAGYAAYFSKNKCVEIPANAHLVESASDAWLCDAGYVEKNNKCYVETLAEKVMFDDCNDGFIKDYSVGTCNLANNAGGSKSLLNLDPFNTLKLHDNGAYYITGNTSNNCYLIEVLAYNLKTKQTDKYFLKSYFLGNTTFKYGIREDWNNMQNGINYYRFTAYCAGGTQSHASTVVRF